MDKNDILSAVILKKLKSIQVGIIVQGVGNIDPEKIVKLVKRQHKDKIYAAVIGYSITDHNDNSDYVIDPTIQKAVLWRSDPKYSRNIIVFIEHDSEKLNSLAEFDRISSNNLSKYILEQKADQETSKPIHKFWKSLANTSDYYPFESISDFVNSIRSGKETSDIPDNMWRLNLLRDESIFDSKIQPIERLLRNQDLILELGQLTANSRKNISSVLLKAPEDEKSKLQEAFSNMQEYYKYGDSNILKKLDFQSVSELLSAASSSSKKRKEKQKANATKDTNYLHQDDINNAIIKSILELDSDCAAALQDLRDKFQYAVDNRQYGHVEIDDGLFSGKLFRVKKPNGNIRKLIGKVCSEEAWGGVLETEKESIKDALSSDIDDFGNFNPFDSEDKKLSFEVGESRCSLFDFIKEFDNSLEAIDGSQNQLEAILQNIIEKRNTIIDNLDLFIYEPNLALGALETNYYNLENYLKSWQSFYSLLNENYKVLREESRSTEYLVKTILLLDLLYIKTPTSLKCILMPTHPLYLWKYYEIFHYIYNARKKEAVPDDEKSRLTDTLGKQQQVINFITVNSQLYETKKYVLSYAGDIDNLPIFDNKNDEYFGNDGISNIEDIIKIWEDYAPYTNNEIRVCSVDANDLKELIKIFAKILSNGKCKKIISYIYSTKNQNYSLDLSELDLSGDDYDIGEFIKKDQLIISIKNVNDLTEVKECLKQKPVHIAFYFDQTKINNEFGPSSKSLFINPLVVTYNYEYDVKQRKGFIYPSTNTDTGIIGGYYNLIKNTEIIQNGYPNQRLLESEGISYITSTIEEGLTQWLVMIDVNSKNYQPKRSVPIGEIKGLHRSVNIWTSYDSRYLNPYKRFLDKYPLSTNMDVLTKIFQRFGHIGANGLSAIPKFSDRDTNLKNQIKGLLGTLFAAQYYTHGLKNSLVISLDNSMARIWLQERDKTNKRADLIGLRYYEDEEILFVEPIEVKTWDENLNLVPYEKNNRKYLNTHPAVEQINETAKILEKIFYDKDAVYDILNAARRESLKYQIYSECFKSIYGPEWQKKWDEILKAAFDIDEENSIKVVISGVLVNINLSINNEEQIIEYYLYEKNRNYDISIIYVLLTAKNIQDIIFEENWDKVRKYSPHALEHLPQYANHQESQTQQPQTQQPPLPITDGEDIEQLVRDFKRSCKNYDVKVAECESKNAVIGSSLIRIRFKLREGQPKSGLVKNLDDIGREMKRTGLIIQDVHNSDELLLDVPRKEREKVLFSDVIDYFKPNSSSPEQLYFALGKTPEGRDLIMNLADMPHMLVGGSTGSGKSVFLFTMLASLLLTHPKKEDLQLILSSSKMEDFARFAGLPHLYSGNIISDAKEATETIKGMLSEESKRRESLLVTAGVTNIVDYNKKMEDKLAPIVVVIDEFADLADQLETRKSKDEFYNPVQRIAQAGRSRGIHLVVCTQRPSKDAVPPTTKEQLNARVALRVNNAISSSMILGTGELDAQYLQKKGDMIFRNGDEKERAQGYLITVEELEKIIYDIKNLNK